MGPTLAYETETGGKTRTILIFGASVLFVFPLVLAAQYESWSQAAFGDPDSCRCGLPGGRVRTAAAWAWSGRHSSSNRIRRSGLAAWPSKNAILIVEFAKQAQDEGASVEDAAGTRRPGFRLPVRS